MEVRDKTPLANLARRDFIVVSTETTIFELIATMRRAKAELAVVLSPEADQSSVRNVRGVVTKAHLAEALAEGMEIFED